MEFVEKKGDFWERARHNVYTCFIFVAFISSIPFLLVFYMIVSTCRFLWFRRLERKNPHLELIKGASVRSAMDTYRCQGVVTVLLQIHGSCDVQLVKQRIMEDVVEKRTKEGALRFPHMKKCLMSCWGKYAWLKDTSHFNLDNHVIHYVNPVFRNRVVTSANIQEYVSEAITKYLPPWNKIPPWQILLITTEPNKFYILARLHHLYTSEDGISFGHLLMIKSEDRWIAPNRRWQDMDSIENVLSTIFLKPTALPVLYEKTCQILTNAWNEIVSVYDPLENETLLKEIPTIFQLYAVLAVVAVCAVRRYWKAKCQQTLITVFADEARKREITPFLFLKSLAYTIYPPVIARTVSGWAWWFYVKCCLHFPLSALHVVYDSPVYLKFVILGVRALAEAVYLFRLFYTAPRVLLEELCLPLFQLPKHHLQKVSLSGRKVVAWTDPIPVDMIRMICDRTGVASCEVQLYAVAAALHQYFLRGNIEEPEAILTTTRFIPQENLLKSANKISSGLLCLSLPMKLPAEDPLYGLHLMQLSLQEAMSTQTALYLASLWQYDYGFVTTIFPSIVARIMLYVLSTRYSVMMTQIEAHTKEMRRRHLIWGQEVESFIYWRPPQANISLSLSLISYVDEFRFAVMADAELAPDYAIIVSEYVAQLKLLAEEAENYNRSPAGVVKTADITTEL